MFRLIDDRCVHLVRKWVERRLKNVCSKKRLIIREIEKKKRILYYSKRPRNTETGSR
jgi:hypothetical protein